MAGSELVGGHQDLPAGGHEDGMAVITVSGFPVTALPVRRRST